MGGCARLNLVMSQQTLSLTTRWTRALPVALVAGLIIAIDQVSKFMVRGNFYLGESKLASWPARLTYVENTGSAFGLFAGQTVFLIIASIFAIGIVVYLFRRAGQTSVLLRVCLGMMLGGGVSNMADRIRLGTVTDFIDLRVWPIFNLADSSVVVGIALLAFIILWWDKRGAAAL